MASAPNSSSTRANAAAGGAVGEGAARVLGAETWLSLDERTHGEQGPVRAQLVPLPANVRASDCCSVMIALQAAAIARNLDCVLTSVDAEGPHQFRVALRRLRVVLRTFRPIMRETGNELLVDAARRMAAIVSDLRDADVFIDELIGPAASDPGETHLMQALNGWRQELRGRVRARLLAAGAPAFASGLVSMAGTFAWRRRSERARGCSARDLISGAIARRWRRVGEAAARLPQVGFEEVHEFRKHVKALRYAVELADAVSLNSDPKLARSLKRIQDGLGYANDMASLHRFSPPLLREKDALVRLRDRVVRDHADDVAASVACAAARLRELEAPSSCRA